jgi:ABC-type dipeptide/oligopeptide/nickel transport system permease subunit
VVDTTLVRNPSVPPAPKRGDDRPSLGRRLLQAGAELWHDKTGFFGLLLVVLFVLTALLAPLLAPYDPSTQSLDATLVPPFWEHGGSLGHPLGTDQLGRDLLSRVIYGSRVSLLVGSGVVVVSMSVGVFFGVISGYFGGRVDGFIMRVVDTQGAFPGLLLAMLILAAVGPSVKTVMIVLMLDGWLVYARVARGTVLSVRETAYVEAAEIVGCRSGRVMFRHILPNLTSPILTLAVLEFARVVLAEAVLSFLGLGVQPPQMSWGLEIAEGQDYVYSNWWLVTIPGIAIVLTVLGVNLFASWLRVAADPQEREKRFAASVPEAALVRPE